MAPASCLFSYIKIEDVLLKGLVPVICTCFHLVCSKRIETLISECLCIFIGRIQVIFIGLWPGTQSRIGTTRITGI